MTAFNAVRFRVKPEREQEFLDAHVGFRKAVRSRDTRPPSERVSHHHLRRSEPGRQFEAAVGAGGDGAVGRHRPR